MTWDLHDSEPTGDTLSQLAHAERRAEALADLLREIHVHDGAWVGEIEDLLEELGLEL